MDEETGESSINNDNKEIIDCEDSSIPLFGRTAANDDEAYDLYNDYAFQMGFSIRKSKKVFNKKDQLTMREYCCSKEGFKRSVGKYFTQNNTRTGCKAKIVFHVDSHGEFTVVQHDIKHNHDLCPEDKTFLLRSHRKVRKEDVEYLLQLVDGGIKVSAALRVLKKERGGSPLLGFLKKDGYNIMAEIKKERLSGGDCKTLMEIFNKRSEEEDDFYYDFFLGDGNEFKHFFWRDKKMLQAYENFGDLVIHDTTRNTNKYDLSCAPFVGINHQTKNVMFGVGFLSEEDTEAFKWLFATFLKSMKGKHPKTLMTDQCGAMAAARKIVFPYTQHRLCIWHIEENSKKHIKGLRSLGGFLNMFNQVLKYCETEAEFEFYWKMYV